MLNKRFYSFQELDEVFNCKFTNKNGRAKLIKRNIEPYYFYETVKEGRSQIGLNIIDFKKAQKTEFIMLCEKIYGSEVKFPKEETAEKILRVLSEKDRTILNNEEIGYEVPGYLERHTIGKYIHLFRQYKILPAILPKVERLCFNKETSEIFSKTYDPNKYTYYVVSVKDEVRDEITASEYYEMVKYMTDRYSEHLLEYLHVLESDGYNQKVKEEMDSAYSKEAKQRAAEDCVREHGGIPKKSVSKYPTPESLKLLLPYFRKIKAA